MNEPNASKIVFEVETSRILEILAREIYDSPLALVRENLQNAYDAVLMRSASEGRTLDASSIEILVEPLSLTIIDNGIGMTEDVLRNNFWKAGSSGKKSELAQRAGVIGTFGIGAMANFGICTSLRVETKSVSSDVTLISTAELATLSISKECIDLERIHDDREPGTKLIAILDPKKPLSVATIPQYLAQYVAYLPVRVLLNGDLIGQQSYKDQFLTKDYRELSSKLWTSGSTKVMTRVLADSNGRVAVYADRLSINSTDVTGDLLLVQGQGQVMGLRNYFGLAPIPVSAYYQLGGIVNLSTLQPTAGREALSRESILGVSALITLIEDAVSQVIATTDVANRNTSFLQFASAHMDRPNLAAHVTIRVLPEDEEVPLGEVLQHCIGRTSYYYVGHEAAILQTFANETSSVLHVSPNQPRRQLQIQYIQRVLKVAEVPDRATVLHEYLPTELSIEEASLLARIGSTLSGDYLLPNAEICFADISHNVVVLVEKRGDTVYVYLARRSPSIGAVLTTYRTAYEVFDGFVKDFVRNNLYQRISAYVPSSTKEGSAALVKLLQRNRELYRYEESDLGEVEPLLGDYLSGEKTLAQVIVAARSVGRAQTQYVSREQVGSLEQALPDVVESPGVAADAQEGLEFEAALPILRPDIECNLKILVAGSRHQQLNDFELFLGLSDRLMRREGEFFNWPHTTKVIWAGHRIIYIFTEVSGKVTLYYDIELREPRGHETASGGMFPTTTIVTKNRIYVPVPSALDSVFRIVEGAKEFFVRFDTVVN